jgi:hypothetical protein
VLPDLFTRSDAEECVAGVEFIAENGGEIGVRLRKGRD